MAQHRGSFPSKYKLGGGGSTPQSQHGPEHSNSCLPSLGYWRPLCGPECLPHSIVPPAGGRGPRQHMACPLPFKGTARRVPGTPQFTWNPIGQSLVTWPHPVTRTRKCRLYSGQSSAQLETGACRCYEREGENGYRRKNEQSQGAGEEGGGGSQRAAGEGRKALSMKTPAHGGRATCVHPAGAWPECHDACTPLWRRCRWVGRGAIVAENWLGRQITDLSSRIFQDSLEVLLAPNQSQNSIERKKIFSFHSFELLAIVTGSSAGATGTVLGGGVTTLPDPSAVAEPTLRIYGQSGLQTILSL